VKAVEKKKRKRKTSPSPAVETLVIPMPPPREVESHEEEDEATEGPPCSMDLPGPTTSVGTRTDYSVGPWDYSTCATRHLMAWSARTTVEEYSDRKLCMSGSM
jgi:hypothetical protein